MFLKKESFEGMIINPFDVKDVYKEHTEFFLEIFGAKKHYQRVDLSKMTKYVLYMYDHKSPMRKYYQDITMRKQECAALAGYHILRDKKKLERFYNFEDDVFMAMVLKLLKFQNAKKFAVLQSNTEVLWQYQEELLKPISMYKSDKEKYQAMEVKAKLMSESEVIIKRIDMLEKLIYGDEAKLLDGIEGAAISPEMRARKRKENNLS